MRIAAKYATIAVIMAANRTLSALMPKTRQILLRELVLADREYLHVRELERRTGVYSVNLSRELRKLKAGGIVESKSVGRQLHYRLSEQCPIYPELKQMIVKTVGVADVLREALAPMAARLELAYIYGSFANGNARPDSDVDLMVVGDVSSREVYSVADDCTAILRREVHAAVFSPGEYAAKLGLGRGFIHETHFGPVILLIGGDRESG